MKGGRVPEDSKTRKEKREESVMGLMRWENLNGTLLLWVNGKIWNDSVRNVDAGKLN